MSEQSDLRRFNGHLVETKHLDLTSVLLMSIFITTRMRGHYVAFIVASTWGFGGPSA